MMLCGLGFGFFQAPNNRTILASAPRAAQRRGRRHTERCAAARPERWAPRRWRSCFAPMRAAGSNIALWVAALLALTGAVVSAGRLRSGREAHA